MFLLVAFKHVCNMFNFLISRVRQFLLFDILSHLSIIDASDAKEIPEYGVFARSVLLLVFPIHGKINPKSTVYT